MDTNKRMKWTIGLLLAAAVLCMGIFSVQGVWAKDINVTLAWDADIKPEDQSNYTEWDRLLFYARQGSGDGTYDYLSPLKVLPQTYSFMGPEDPPVEKSAPSTTTVTLTVPDDVISQWYFVVRSANGDLNSADSDEVGLEVNLTPLPAATNFVAVYNETSQSIDFSWDNDATGRVKQWKVFAGDVEGGPYPDEVATITAGAGDTSATVPMDSLFPAREDTTKYFTLVAFAPWDIFSPDAAEQPISINRIPAPGTVVNFKLILQ